MYLGLLPEVVNCTPSSKHAPDEKLYLGYLRSAKLSDEKFTLVICVAHSGQLAAIYTLVICKERSAQLAKICTLVICSAQYAAS